MACTSGFSAAACEEHVEGGRERAGGIVEVGVDGAFDGDEEAIGLAHDEDLGELVTRAELLVERLAADAGGERDVGHRDVGPSGGCWSWSQAASSSVLRSSSRAAME